MKKYYYKDDNLYDEDGRSVMMGWERPIMKLVSDLICFNKGDILNIGYGMGIVDNYIQENSPNSHTIIERHPDIIEKMISDGWETKATCYFDSWQDHLGEMGMFDGIYLDTWFDNRKSTIVKQLLDDHLKVGGVFSIWYNEGEFNSLVKILDDRYEVELYKIKNDNLISLEQYLDGGTYIDPKSEYITVPTIKKKY